MPTFEEEETVETTLQNLLTQLVCVSIGGRFPKTLLQVKKKKKRNVCGFILRSPLWIGVVCMCYLTCQEHQKHEGYTEQAQPVFILFPRRHLLLCFFTASLK